MEARKNTSPAPQFDRDRPAPEVRIRTGGDARRALASLLDGESELKRSAAEFFKLGGQIAGRAADPEERDALFRDYYERILHHPAARSTEPEARSEAVAETLEEMRAENLRRRSTFEAHRAHIEVESYRDGRDDFRALYDPPEDRTRAEHAGHLHNISQDARDAYERGATVYGDVLVIPRESVGKATSADQVRAGSHAHAVSEFTPLVGEGRAKEVAAEFVELGRQIAGRTSDGNARLVVFRSFYNEITLDAATGKLRSRDEQAAQIEPTLERMRVLAEAMRAAEWKRDRAEFVEIGEWEGGHEGRQRDAEHEAHGRLTYRIENIPGLEPERGEFEEQARERAEDERGEIAGRVPSVEYERVRLSGLPPRLPDGLTEEDERRLRYEIVPRIDRQLENGARPRDITGWLSALQRAEAERARDDHAARLMLARSPDANREHPLTRAEELRALYTLHALSGDRDRGKVVEEIARLAPSERERAEAMEMVGARLAQEYRREAGRLKAYEAAEAERERLTGEALGYESARRASAEFQLTLQHEREQERERAITEREALIRSNNARHRNVVPQTRVTAYPELTGETRPLSPYAELRQAHAEERRQAREHLAEQLTSPGIEQARRANLAEIEGHRWHFSRVAGREVMSAQEARAELEPQIKRQRATLDRLSAERSQIEVERSRPREKFFNPVFIGLGDGRLRLPVENFNEYRTLTKTAGKLNLNARIYESPRGREITGERAERDAAYTFAREYVSYRAQDDVTRLRNEKRLFREYAARLDRARSGEELRAEINDIRRDNYRRATQPEQFADESREAVRRTEQPRRPLTTVEMRKLFLSPAPEHYTAEMRELRRSRAESGRDRAERVSSLERGGREPSPALSALLREFDRTRHDSPERYSRNIRLFLGDYLNPPAPDKNRFSPENLHELGKRLEPAERDYFFRVVDSTRRALTAGVPVREIVQDGWQARTHQIDTRSHQPDGASEQEVVSRARTQRDSTSFSLYYGAATWREAGQIAAALYRNGGDKPFSRERETVVRGIRDHDLETVATLLVEFASKPDRIEAAVKHLRSSEERERRQLGEILQTFRAMEVSHDSEEGRLRFQITTPANSELGRAEWERLLDHLPARAGASRGTRLPEAQRGRITRAALDLAWQDVEAAGRQYARTYLDGHGSGEAGNLQLAIERGSESQKRARIASDLLHHSLTSHAERAARALEREGLLPEDPSAVRKLTRIALDPKRSQEYALKLETQSGESQRDETAKAKEQFAIISNVVTSRDQDKQAQLTAYAARTKAEYLEGFSRIDEQLVALARGTREQRTVERVEAFRPVRGEMESRVAAYLTDVVRSHGVVSLEREAAHHTEVVSRVIKEAFRERGYNMSAFNLSDERVNRVAGKLVGELPGAIRDASRNREQAHDREHGLGDISRRDHLLPSQAHESATTLHTQAAPAPDGRSQPAARRQAASAHLHHPDDEFVEQRVSPTIGQVQQQAPPHSLPTSDLEYHHLQNRAAHAPDIADTREQQAHRYILTR
jgi:hypothetical protein